MANLAALRAAVFSLSAKNLRGGGVISAPPAVRGLMVENMQLGMENWSYPCPTQLIA